MIVSLAFLLFHGNNGASMKQRSSLAFLLDKTKDRVFGIPIVSWEQWCLKDKMRDRVFGIPIVPWEQCFCIPIVSWKQWCLRDKIEDHVFGIPIVHWNNGARGMKAVGYYRDKGALGI
ncbi:hypothetical protein ACFE04_012357 [Oxalis oulophora]